jgi:adenosine kinase
MNSIASFYPGAMGEDSDIDLGSVAGRAGGFDLALIGASDPAAMAAFTAQCRKHAIPFAADTSWQLARLDGEEVRDLVEGAAYLFCNEYEATLTERKTGWTGGQIVEHVGVRVTTLGAAGARVDRLGEPPVIVGPVPGVVPQEPTGAGDAFRAGFLAAIAWGLQLERAAQLGNMMAVHALETVGTQEYELTPARLAERLTVAYGPQAAAEVAEHYR